MDGLVPARHDNRRATCEESADRGSLPKNIIKQSQGTSIAQGLAWENDGYTLCMSTEDAAEASRPLAKSANLFRGR